MYGKSRITRMLALADRSCWAGDAYGTLPTPSRSGYKFNGWYPSAPTIFVYPYIFR